MLILVKTLLLAATALYQAVACLIEDFSPPPGQRFDVGGHRLHLYTIGDASPSIILDHSLGGVEGYLLVEQLANLGQVCIYDRAGYGWSDHSLKPRTSDQIVTELDVLLTKADIRPPYIMVGDSFGSYNVRLYAHRFPHKVLGIVLTDGLHEAGMLEMSFPLKMLKFFFVSGFLMSIFGASFGIIRLLKVCGTFEFLKPELRNFPDSAMSSVKRSFCRPKHWITMIREMLNLDASARQLSARHERFPFPVVNIKADSFFKPAWWTRCLPLQGANQLREQMHRELMNLSNICIQLQAKESSHFVWVDQPEVMIEAVQTILDEVLPSRVNNP
jgi:pimeloyl-ACP methyl ester carboxylesterase